MKKAVMAALVTALTGWFLAGWLVQLPEIGCIAAVAVMGGFIIYFNEQKK